VNFFLAVVKGDKSSVYSKRGRFIFSTYTPSSFNRPVHHAVRSRCMQVTSDGNSQQLKGAVCMGVGKGVLGVVGWQSGGTNLSRSELQTPHDPPSHPAAS
jgi:hypothetical protein